MEGSVDCTNMRPPRPFEIWLRAPRDISTARTIAWSPPTRACDTLRDAVAVGAAEPGGAIPERGPAGRTGSRNMPLAGVLPLQLTERHGQVAMGSQLASAFRPTG